MEAREETIERLRQLPARRAALDNLPERIKALEAQFVALKAARTDGDPVSGGTNHREDSLINNICERELLQANLEYTKAEVAAIERNLEAMKPNERRALELFYINGEKYAAQRLADEIGYSIPQVRRIKNAAVKNLTYRLYGRLLL